MRHAFLSSLALASLTFANPWPGNQGSEEKSRTASVTSVTQLEPLTCRPRTVYVTTTVYPGSDSSSSSGSWNSGTGSGSDSGSGSEIVSVSGNSGSSSGSSGSASGSDSGYAHGSGSGSGFGYASSSGSNSGYGSGSNPGSGSAYGSGQGAGSVSASALPSSDSGYESGYGSGSGYGSDSRSSANGLGSSVRPSSLLYSAPYPSSGYKNSSRTTSSAVYSTSATASDSIPRSSSRTASSSRNSTLSATSSSASSSATPCAGNTANDRQKWCDYDINTDYYDTVPETNVTREYWLVLDQTIGAPDGVSRYVQTVNGTSPGPTIWANWGDWVIIHVKNNLPDSSLNGTTMHWHGIRQNYTNQMDGVSSVTQCPIVPGESYTYKWRATQYGSSWYHSHWGLQAWEGVYGGIVIHGPASANYDVDLGNLFLSDWDHTDADILYASAALGAALTYDTGLINGTMVWDDGDTTVGNYFETKFEAGTSYLLRLVNVAIDSGFKFMIDNHTLTVIAADFVPIEPYTTDYVQLTMGQRYDVIVTANSASVANEFWMRSIPQSACSANANQNNILGIVRYTDSSALPTTAGYTFVDECVDETQLVPVVAKTVGGVDALYDEPASVIRNAQNYVSWTLNGTTYLVHWDDPTLLDVAQNSVSETSGTTNLIRVPNAGEWVYVVIEAGFVPITHPIHLHGHDFFVVASGSTTYDPTAVTYNLVNPPRRDVALLPTSGYLVLAFETDNPGAWLMHCHIGWHTMEGFALQFLEMEDVIHSQGLIDSNVLDQSCNSWNTYADTWDPIQGVDGLEDSGI